ncbi:MAG TPA: type II toxin-antitoxin system HicA family toxin, partial [Solirubrobacteraceae bacterium]|nr:type II toxin-antitoxin system HicA family toxin [Solirubrobacteraceae bacterium]
MSRPPLNQRTAITLLKRHGWEQQTGGKHSVKMTRPGDRPVTLPQHSGHDYGPGLTAAVLKQAGLDTKGDGKWISRSKSTTRIPPIGLRSVSSRDASR